MLIPVAGEEAVVTPVIAQVSAVTVQLSLVVGFGITIVALHAPASEFIEMPAGQLMTGSWLSVMITVKLHVAKLFAASFTV